MDNCRHKHHSLVTSIDYDGRRHAWHRCLDCGENARGLFHWADEDELVGVNLDQLPCVRDNRREAWVILMVQGEPRKDLADDSELWLKLLDWAWSLDHKHRAFNQDQSVFLSLWGLRCQGLRLRQAAKGWVLRPEYGAEAFDDAAQWAAMRERYLVPHRKAVEGLLERLPVAEPVGVA